MVTLNHRLGATLYNTKAGRKARPAPLACKGRSRPSRVRIYSRRNLGPFAEVRNPAHIRGEK
jgi:hypothetical protein